MAQTIPVTDAGFSAQVLRSGRPVLVEFWQQGCAPCAALKPTLDRFAGERSDLDVVTYEVAQRAPEQRLWKRYGIMHTPTLILFRDGEQIWRSDSGLRIEQLRLSIDAALAAPPLRGVA